jgi:hypothetical protein
VDSVNDSVAYRLHYDQALLLYPLSQERTSKITFLPTTLHLDHMLLSNCSHMLSSESVPEQKEKELTFRTVDFELHSFNAGIAVISTLWCTVSYGGESLII